MWWLLKEPLFYVQQTEDCLLAAGVFGDGFGAFADGVLGQFTGKKKTNSGLDLSRCNGGLLVVVSKAGSFTSDALEDVLDERVHDGHGFAGDTGVRMDLFHDFVDVDGVSFLPPSGSLLLVTDRGLLAGFLFTFLSDSSGFWRHFVYKFRLIPKSNDALTWGKLLFISKSNWIALTFGSQEHKADWWK